MDDLDKLELIHCAIQEVIKLNLPSGLDEEMENALELIEDLREPHLTEQDKDEQAKIEQKKEQDFELGADYGRVNGWYSDTFGDSFSDPYDY